MTESVPEQKLVGGELVRGVAGTIGKTAIVPQNFAGCNLVRLWQDGLGIFDFWGCVSSVYVAFECEPDYGYFFCLIL